MRHKHIVEPYGWVKMRDCVVEERTVPRFDFDHQCYRGTRTEKVVLGTVEESSYCGALLCGVPIPSKTVRYPVGSRYECVLRSDYDLQVGVTREIAM